MPAALDPNCIFATLDEHNVDYVLIGGLAAVLHGSTAMTNDADIFPSPDKENLDKLSQALRSLDARLRSPDTPDGLPFDPHPTLIASMSMLKMHTRCGDLDLAFTPAGLDSYADVKTSAVVFRVNDIDLQVAALADIIRSKETANRPKDHATLPILRALQEEIGE